MQQLRELRVEGERIARPRNVRRVNIEVVSDVVGACIGPHHLAPGTNYVEVYADELRSIADRVKTAHHRACAKDAQAMAHRLNTRWREENKGAIDSAAKQGDAIRDRFLRDHEPNKAIHFYANFGYPRGLPPFSSLVIVSQDESQRIEVKDTEPAGDDGALRYTLAEWDTLSDADRGTFLRVPPRTAGNESDRLAAALANALAERQGRRTKG